MNQQWQIWSEKFLALTQREKVIIAVAAIFLTAYGLYMLLLEPSLLTNQAQRKALSNKSNEISLVRNQIMDLQAALAKDPNEAVKKDIERLKNSLLDINTRLDNVMTDYVAPEQMTRELTKLLNASPKIRIVGVTTLPPEPLNTNVAQSEQDKPVAPYFYHQLDITIEGQYFPLMEFVKRIMVDNKRFTVTNLNYQVTEHPTAQMSLSLATISDSENVIRL